MLREASLIWFSRNAQRRADKPGRHAHGVYLAARGGFAKRKAMPQLGNKVAGSTFTPGPMVEEMATRLMK